jgi:hypothetical protein
VLARDRECLFVALPDLLGGDSLLEAIVPCQEEMVDLLARFGLVHFAATLDAA